MMKEQSRAMSGFTLPCGARYPHLAYGLRSEILLKAPQYHPLKTDYPVRPLAQVLYKPRPIYHSTRIYLPLLHQIPSHVPYSPYTSNTQVPLDFRPILGPPLRRPAKPMLDGTLTLHNVVEILRLCIYSETKQEVTCPVCSKKYKSKVCLTKHLWEHTIYWSQFQGMKNHERVLCIQTALILSKNPYSSILVTAPCKKKAKYRQSEIRNTVQTDNAYFRDNKNSKPNTSGNELSRLNIERCVNTSFTKKSPTEPSSSGIPGREQENCLSSHYSDSVEDFLHFTASINDAARNSANTVHSSPNLKRKRQSPPWSSEHQQDMPSRTLFAPPQQGWYNSSTSGLMQVGGGGTSHDSYSNSRSADDYTTDTKTSGTATSAAQQPDTSNRVSPRNNSGDSGADDSGYGTSERQEHSAYEHGSSWQNEETGGKQYINEPIQMEPKENKRLAEFLEEHQQGQERKTMKFDWESNESRSSCQPLSHNSSGDEGRRSANSLVSRESDEAIDNEMSELYQYSYKKEEEAKRS